MGSGPEAASGSHPGAEQSISKKRVLIVGAGAAGTACAWALGRSEQFLVEVWEKCEVAGGQATTVTLRDGLRINDGVQGGTPSYRNTLNLLELCGMQPHYVNLRICFGMGEKRWNNFGEKTELIRKNKEQIVRFGRVLKTVSKYETFFVPIPIKTLLWMYGFSKEFMYDMVFPLTALFFGTGNQTPNVSSAIFARVFTDADLKLFEYDNETLLSQAPTMFAFRELEDYYKKLVDITNARFSFGRSAARITRTKKNVTVVDNNGSTSEFDEIIFACSPETSLSMLTKPTRMERTTLGSVKFYNDVTVTHEDMDYMKKHYDLNLARNEMYFIKTYKEDPSKLEMSFDLSHYQPHISSATDRHVYQSIFLDDANSQMWTIDEIDKDKTLYKKWWRQFAHTWKHYVNVVPWVRFLQGKWKSWFCGSWTVVNTHEMAVISGLAVAYRLGAAYPFEDDRLASLQFYTYLRLVHGVKPRKPRTKA